MQFGEQNTMLDNLAGKQLVLGWVDGLYSRSQHRRRPSLSFQRPLMSRRVNTKRQPADDTPVAFRQFVGHLLRQTAAVGPRLARAYNGDGPFAGGSEVSQCEQHRRDRKSVV